MKLDTYAPKKVQGWAHFPTFAWIRSSQQAFSWFSRHSKEDIQCWRNGIKKELGGLYWLYRINAECLRFGFLSVFLVHPENRYLNGFSDILSLKMAS